MKEVVFVTSNQGKVRALARRIDQTKYNIVQKDIDIPEIQANNAVEIATFKAKYAYDQLKKPVIVQDSSFHVNALNGFPGPYIKFVNETLGPKGLLRLMQGVEDRSCFFELALVYADESGETHAFVNDAEPGRLAEEIYEGDSENAWSSLWKIYVPPHFNKTLAEFTSEELTAKETSDNDKSEFTQFVTWLKDR